MPKISYYYQEMKNVISTSEDIPALIDLHCKSFSDHGWEAVLVNESDAKQHPLYSLFDRPDTILAKSRNPWEYTRACYMRWLAYAVAGNPYADFDVINYGLSPEDARQIKADDHIQRPIFLSAAGAVGLLGPQDYAQVLEVYQSFMENPIIDGSISEDINDMTILRQLRPQWYEAVPYPDDRFSKDYLNPGWETTKLCHFPYATTPPPRAMKIQSVRPIRIEGSV